jgi:hypothetical protein
MNIKIQIHYISNENKVLQRGLFPLKNNKPEVVALDFWKWIKKEHPYESTIEKVICEGKDITDSVKKLEKAPLDYKLYP